MRRCSSLHAGIDMTDAKTIEVAAILAYAKENSGISHAEILEIRNAVGATLAAKRRYRHAYTAPAFEWKKPAPKR